VGQENYPDRMSRALNSKPDLSYLDMPNRTLTNMLGRLGIETLSRKPGKDENGKRGRLYRLGEDSRTKMVGYAIRNLGLTIEEVQRRLENLSYVYDSTFTSGRRGEHDSTTVISRQDSSANNADKTRITYLENELSIWQASLRAFDEWFAETKRASAEALRNGEVEIIPLE